MHALVQRTRYGADEPGEIIQQFARLFGVVKPGVEFKIQDQCAVLEMRAEAQRVSGLRARPELVPSAFRSQARERVLALEDDYRLEHMPGPGQPSLSLHAHKRRLVEWPRADMLLAQGPEGVADAGSARNVKPHRKCIDEGTHHLLGMLDRVLASRPCRTEHDVVTAGIATQQ